MLGHPPSHGGQRVDEQVERVHDGLGVVVADVRPDRRMPGGDAGHVPEAAGGQLEQGGVLLAEARGQVHEGCRRQVRDVGDHRHQRVVLGRGEGHHVGPEVGEDAADPGVGGRVGRGGGGQHPGGAHEQLGRGALDADLLRPGHRVAAHERRMVDGRHQRSLHTTHVGDHRSGVGGGHRLDDPGGGVHRGGHHHQVGLVVHPLFGEGPERHRPGRHPVGGVDAAHHPALFAQRHPHRAADEPGAEDHGPSGDGGPRPRHPVRAGVRGAAALSRGGRHGVPGRPRGRHGGSRHEGVPC